MLKSQRHQFRLPPEVSYLNCAYMSPLMESVAAAGKIGIDSKFRPDLLRPADFFTDIKTIKALFAQLIESQAPLRTAIIPSVSYGIGIAANNTPLQAGQKILLLEEQFPSNYYCWERVAQEKGAQIQIIASPEGDKHRAARWNQLILDAIDEDTAVISLPHVHWADGTRFDLKAIRAKTRSVGALLIIDGTQSVGALPFSIQEFEVDALVCGAYKWLLGPYSLGLAYFGPAFDNGKPLEENWINRTNSEDFRRLIPYDSEYLPAAGRYSVGEQSNFILLPMAIAALKQLLDWKVAEIQDYAARLQAPFLGRLGELGARFEVPEGRGAHLFGIRLNAAQLSVEKLEKAREKHRVMLSQRGDALRISVNVFNDEQDLQRLVRCFEEAQL